MARGVKILLPAVDGGEEVEYEVVFGVHTVQSDMPAGAALYCWPCFAFYCVRVLNYLRLHSIHFHRRRFLRHQERKRQETVSILRGSDCRAGDIQLCPAAIGVQDHRGATPQFGARACHRIADFAKCRGNEAWHMR